MPSEIQKNILADPKVRRLQGCPKVVLFAAALRAYSNGYVPMDEVAEECGYHRRNINLALQVLARMKCFVVNRTSRRALQQVRIHPRFLPNAQADLPLEGEAEWDQEIPLGNDLTPLGDDPSEIHRSHSDPRVGSGDPRVGSGDPTLKGSSTTYDRTDYDPPHAAAEGAETTKVNPRRSAPVLPSSSARILPALPPALTLKAAEANVRCFIHAELESGKHHDPDTGTLNRLSLDESVKTYVARANLQPTTGRWITSADIGSLVEGVLGHCRTRQGGERVRMTDKHIGMKRGELARRSAARRGAEFLATAAGGSR